MHLQMLYNANEEYRFDGTHKDTPQEYLFCKNRREIRCLSLSCLLDNKFIKYPMSKQASISTVMLHEKVNSLLVTFFIFSFSKLFYNYSKSWINCCLDKLRYLYSLFLCGKLNELINDFRDAEFFNHAHSVVALFEPIFELHHHWYRCCWGNLLYRVRRIRYPLRELDVIYFLSESHILYWALIIVEHSSWL
jgi:hypothetical protein